jgi:hypothetical protein
MGAGPLAVLLHIVAEHPGGMAVDTASVALIALSVGLATYVIASRDETPRAPSRRGAAARDGQPWPFAAVLVPEPLVPEFRRAAARPAPAARARALPRPGGAAALSAFFLLILGIQGFHVIEHIVLVVQVEALGIGLERAHALLGARVDFEWLHFSYNLSFLAALALLLVYSLRLQRDGAAVASWVVPVMVGAVALQSYHMVEHTARIVQYYQSGCNPCVGLVGKVVLFIWPHLFFGLFTYGGMVAAYFGTGLYRALVPRPRRALVAAT